MEKQGLAGLNDQLIENVNLSGKINESINELNTTIEVLLQTVVSTGGEYEEINKSIEILQLENSQLSSKIDRLEETCVKNSQEIKNLLQYIIKLV